MDNPRFPILVVLIIGTLTFALGFGAGLLWKEHAGGGQAATPAQGGPKSDSAQLWTCGMHPQVIQDKPGMCPICHMKLTPIPPGGSTARTGAGVKANAPGVTIDPVVVQNMGIRAAEASEGPLKSTIRAVGYLHEAQPLQRDFSVKVRGWVKRLLADTEGVHVQKGTALFELYSPELFLAQEELIAARRALDELPRASSPLVRKEVERTFESAREKLILWDVSPEDVHLIAQENRARPTITFRSPVAGHVVEKMVVEGSAVEPGMKLFRIVDHSTLWLEAHVYEQHVPFLALGQRATARVLAVPGKEFSGQVSFIHPHMDETTRTLTVRITVGNSDFELRPGMHASVFIHAQLAERALLVPREAVIDTGARQIAFVVKSGGRFEPRDVRLGAEGDGGLVQVLEGLAAGEKVVTSGQFLLDVESRTQEAIQKLMDERLLLKGKREQQGAAGDLVSVEVRQAVQAEVDAVLRAYLDIGKALAADEGDQAAQATALSAAAQALLEKAAGGPLRAAAQSLFESSRSLPRQPLGEFRKRFMPVSDALILLLKQAPPSAAAAAAKVLVIHCPMFPGQWLQADGKVANPYYGSSMLECGEVVRVIEAESRK